MTVKGLGTWIEEGPMMLHMPLFCSARGRWVLQTGSSTTYKQKIFTQVQGARCKTPTSCSSDLLWLMNNLHRDSLYLCLQHNLYLLLPARL
jgi:hypothetical protein